MLVMSLLFSRTIAGKPVDFFSSTRPGVHIRMRAKDGSGTVSDGATVKDVRLAISEAHRREGAMMVRQLPVLNLT